MQRILRIFNDIDSDLMTPAHVRSATLIQLPFHLCTGKLFQVTDPDDSTRQLWFRNKVSIPNGEEGSLAGQSFNIFDIANNNPESLRTDALVIKDTVEFRDGEFEAIKHGKSAGLGLASIINPGFDLLNEAIAAHQMVRLGPYISSGGIEWPRILTHREIIDRIFVEVLLVINPETEIDESHINELFGNIDLLPFSETSMCTGQIDDYSDEQLVELQKGIVKVRSHAFYELRTSAIAAMLSGDSIVAIILACAAAEGAHGTYLTHALKIGFKGSDSDFKKFLHGFLREQGFYSLVQLTTWKILPSDQRPSTEELNACLEGIEIRNAIMHAGKKSGRYKFKTYSKTKIDNGYKGIMKVYFKLESAVEKMEKNIVL